MAAAAPAPNPPAEVVMSAGAAAAGIGASDPPIAATAATAGTSSLAVNLVARRCGTPNPSLLRTSGLTPPDCERYYNSFLPSPLARLHFPGCTVVYDALARFM